MAKPTSILRDHLSTCGLLEDAKEISDGIFKITWGKATVICAAHESAVVALAPVFPKLPEKREGEFCRKILELNSEVAGTAAFAIQSDGSVVVQSGRGISGLDAEELKLLMTSVGSFADEYRAKLKEEFYA